MSITFFKDHITPWSHTAPKRDQNKLVQDKAKMHKYVNQIYQHSQSMMGLVSKAPYESSLNTHSPKDE